MKTDNDLWADAKCTALNVSFLNTKKELLLYANAIYAAIMWGREIDGKNQAIRERDESLK